VLSEVSYSSKPHRDAFLALLTGDRVACFVDDGKGRLKLKSGALKGDGDVDDVIAFADKSDGIETSGGSVRGGASALHPRACSRPRAARGGGGCGAGAGVRSELTRSSLGPLDPTGAYRSTPEGKRAPFVWLTGPNGVRKLVWLVPHTRGYCFDPAAHSALGIVGAGKDARILVNVVGASGAGRKGLEQFPAVLRVWEVGGAMKSQVQRVVEATSAEAQPTLDANEKLGKQGSGVGGSGGGVASGSGAAEGE
jgi:hypothetical protein